MYRCTNNHLATCFVAAAVLALPARADVFTVLNTNNSGADSLRAAITAANADMTPPHTINFNIPGTGPHVITVTSALPTITRQTAIDGSGEAISGAPGIRLTQSGLAATVDGIVFGATADNSSVSYLSITDFPDNGIDISSDGTSVSNCYIGIAPDGTTDAGNGGNGVRVAGTTATIGDGTSTRNIISGNGIDGVSMLSTASFSAVRGNRIGTNAAGTAAVSNGDDGVAVAASGVSVGGNTAGQGNLISGNLGAGIEFSSSSALSGAQGNVIGLHVNGTSALANAGGGIWNTGDDTLIGSTDPVGRNVISGNASLGIMLFTGSDDVEIRGNFIGTNADGDAAIAGQMYGIRVTGTVTDCVIGGNGATFRNVISGASHWGISMESDVSGCTIAGNYIGLNAAGTAAVGNATGVEFGGSNNTLGGDAVGERNVISGNTSYAAVFRGATNKVIGNYVGLNAAGNGAVANTYGIRIVGATGGSIGGTAAGEGNVLSGNTNGALEFLDDSSGVSVLGNKIGTNPAGTDDIANGGGIGVHGTGHTIGGATAAARNLISGNTGTGLVLRGTNQTVYGNYIGTNADGTAAVGNGQYGIWVYDGSGHHVGGAAAGQGNLVSGNGSGGIQLAGTGSFVQGNKVGTNLAGNDDIANGGGIGVYGSGHVVGGDTAGARNVVSGNTNGGFYVTGSNHVISGNYVGTTADGTAALGNGSYGLRADTIVNSVIGGATLEHGNTIAGNTRGVNLGYGSHGNFVLNNTIGLNATGTTDLPDTGTGIEIADSYENTIGQPGMGNVIAGMSYHGIGISGEASYGNVIQGNYIGTNRVAASTLGNDFAGIFITDSSGNTIGGTGGNEGNVLAYNYQFGIWVERGEDNEISGNSIYGNYFGIDIDQQGFYPNDGGDGDDGGNRAQNYPLISSAVVNGGVTDVEGLLVNEPNTQYRVEFFSSPTCGIAGFGQGKTFRGSTQVTTGGGGQAPLAYAIPLAISDDFLTATVTDPSGNTSEFSPCAQVDLGENPGKFQFDRDAYVGYEGIIPTTKVFVTRSHGMSGTATVQFTTSNGSAIAGADYQDSDQTLTFAPWEVVKVVEVPILLEVAPEPDYEKVNLLLSSPSAGASLGTPADSEIQIIDFTDDWPGLTVGDAHVDEGDSGEVVLTFDVNLTPTDHQVKVFYFPEPGSALESEDYEYSEAEITFPASATAQTQQVQITVLGDTDVEADEIVWLRITSAQGGGNWIAYDVYGRGEIRNDDFSSPAPLNTNFADGFETGSTALWSGTVPTP